MTDLRHQAIDVAYARGGIDAVHQTVDPLLTRADRDGAEHAAHELLLTTTETVLDTAEALLAALDGRARRTPQANALAAAVAEARGLPVRWARHLSTTKET